MIRVSLTAVVLLALTLPSFANEDAMSLVPANAATVGMVKLGDLRSSPLAAVLFQHTDKMSSDGEAAEFLREAGLAPLTDVDVLVVASTPRTTLGSDADVLVIAEGRFNVERLTSALVARGAVQKSGYFTLPNEKRGDHDGAVAFPTAALAIAGAENAVAAALAARANGGTGFKTRGALGIDLGRIDPAATAWALVDVTRAARLSKGGAVNTGNGNSGQILQAALRSVSTLAVWATDAGDMLKLGAAGVSSDAETLQLLEDSARGALSALRLSVREKAPDMVTVLRRFDVSRKHDAVLVEGSIPATALRNAIARKQASN